MTPLAAGLLGFILGSIVASVYTAWLAGRCAAQEVRRQASAAVASRGVRRSIDPKTGIETGDRPAHLPDDALGTKIGQPLG